MVAALAYIQQMRDAITLKPRGFTVIGVFLFFGAVMATFAATTLLRRGTPIDRLWALNPTAYNQLAPLGGIVVIFFLALAVTLITAGIGWFRRRCAAELASSSPVHYYCFCCSQESELLLSSRLRKN